MHGPLRFDADELQAWVGAERLALTPKNVELLRVLASRPGALWTKDHLLDAVWGHRHFTEGVIKTAVSELRAALGDDSAAPRWIETVRGHGYRFVGPAGPSPAAPNEQALDPPPATDRSSDADYWLPRETEQAALQAAWSRAADGRRELVLLGGEAGAGKSSLVAAFGRTLQAETLRAVGQCVESRGAPGSFMPWLDALAMLARDEPATIEVLRSHAPGWLAQLPWLATPQERAALQGDAMLYGGHRLMQELAALLERLAEARALFVVLEDMHWADAASVEALDCLARRRLPCRLMVVASYRPVDLVVASHPLADLRRELRLQRLCTDLTVGGFDRTQAAEYAQRRAGGRPLPAAWLDALWRHTEGLPLFLATVMDELLAADPGFDGSVPPPDPLPLPETLGALIDKQSARVPARTRQLLELAAMSGEAFDAAPLAAAAGVPQDEAQRTLASLARRRLWLCHGGERDYAFTHALYRRAFDLRVEGATRVAAHRALYRAFAADPAARADAASLARHAEGAQLFAEAAAWHAAAAAEALSRVAADDAERCAEAGLRCLDRLAAATVHEGGADPVALARLLALRGSARLVRLGSREPQVQDDIARAFEIVASAPPSRESIPLWHAAWWAFAFAGDVGRLDAASARIAPFAAAGGSAAVRAAAQNLVGARALRRGDYAAARAAFEASLAEQAAFEEADRVPSFINDLWMECKAPLVLVHALNGDATASAAVEGEVLARIDAMPGRFVALVGLWYLVFTRAFASEHDRAAALEAQARQRLAGLESLPAAAPFLALLGWVRALRGDVHGGLAELRDGLERAEAAGKGLGGEEFSCHADALLRAGDLHAAGVAIAASMARSQGGTWHVVPAEVLRLRWRLLQQSGAPRDALDQARHAAAAAAAGVPLLMQRLDDAG